MTGPLYRNIPHVEDPAIRLPFRSDRLTMSYFPLPADEDSLQRYLDREINFKGSAYPLPRGVGEFRVASPMVFFVASKHERLASLRGQYGLLAQNEFSFGFFVEWHQKKHGRMCFKDWRFVNAFVFVDSELSTITGRSHWGWPKLQVRVEGGEQLKAGRSCSDVRVFWPERELEANDDQPFLWIRRKPEQYYSGLWGTIPPWLDYPRLLGEYSQNAMAMYSGWARLALGSARWARPEPWQRLFERSRDVLRGGDPIRMLDSQIITVQQFADAEDPAQPCFRALVDSTIETKSLRRGGLLGEDGQMRGDPSGGYRLRIASSKLAPIVQGLGLVVERERRDERGRLTSTLRPWGAFWLQQDVEYGRGKVLATQTKNAPWQTPNGVQRARTHGVSAAKRTSPVGLGVRSFTSERATARANLLFFEADQAVLQATLETYNVGDVRLRAAGSSVCLVVVNSQVPDTKSLWQLAFCVPVLSEDGLPTFVAPFEYTNHARDALNAREVQGRAVRFARIETSAPHWLASPDEARPVLSMSVELLSEVGIDQFARPQPVLELWPNRTLVSQSASSLPSALSRARLLGLKQFRDAGRPELACYQAIVQNELTVEAMVRGESEPLELRIARHPSYDVVAAMGLRVAATSKLGSLSFVHLRPTAAMKLEGSFAWGHSGNINEVFRGGHE